MKKLLVFNRHSELSANDLENCLYDSGAIRDDYLDMKPLVTQTIVLTSATAHYSEWDVAIKGETTDHEWYVIWYGDFEFVFDDPYLVKLSRGFDSSFKGTRGNCQSVVHKPRQTAVVYRLTQELSEKLSQNLGVILECVDHEKYTEQMASVIGLSADYLGEDQTRPKPV